MDEVIKALENSVRAGTVPPHSRIPSERELATRFGVKRHIVRQAIMTLEARGLLYRIDRGGTFVSPVSESVEQKRASSALEAVNFVEIPLAIHPFRFAEARRLQGFSRVLEHHSLRVRFVPLPRSPAEFEQLLHPLVPPERQGCVLGALRSAELMRWLHEKRVPFVLHMYCAYNRRDLPEHHAVFLNRNKAAYVATRHLMEIGHSRIGFVGGLPGGRLSHVQMFKGYESALCLAGHDVEPRYLLDATGGPTEDKREELAQLLSLPDWPTALVCHNDHIAFDVIRAANSVGLRVPADVSLTGFDNDPAGADFDPPLTTFDGNEEMAMRALEILFEVAATRCDEYRSVPIECRMIRRKSTAPPAHTGRGR